MLSLDWKKRLEKDTIDFFENKLPNRDFDIDIIYNAYPIRVDNNVPNEVIRLVANKMVTKLAKKAQDYLEFYDYIWDKKGDSGKLFFSVIMAKLIKKNSDVFLPYIIEKLKNEKNSHIINQLLNKAVYPYLKKNEEKADIIMDWLAIENEVLAKELERLIKKMMKFDKKLIPKFFKQLEKQWMKADERTININVSFLKDVSKIDKDFYVEVYLKYKNTRNPQYINILANALRIYHPVIEKMVEKWCMSGNVHVKKAGTSAQKVIKREKRKIKKKG